jgi:hypothetical protein
MQPGKTVFDVRYGEEWIRVSIDGESAIFHVMYIDDVDIVIEALNKAVAVGAKRGILFSGKVVQDHTATMHTMRAEKGVTWLGGKVYLLTKWPSRPEFRIEWDVLPAVTE